MRKTSKEPSGHGSRPRCIVITTDRSFVYEAYSIRRATAAQQRSCALADEQTALVPWDHLPGGPLVMVVPISGTGGYTSSNPSGSSSRVAVPGVLWPVEEAEAGSQTRSLATWYSHEHRQGGGQSHPDLRSVSVGELSASSRLTAGPRATSTPSTSKARWAMDQPNIENNHARQTSRVASICGSADSSHRRTLA